jgi:hypothetical protein
MTALFSLTNGERNLNCSDIMAADPAILEGFGITGNSVDTDIRITQEAITKLPLNLDILYRLAFLVIAPQQNLDEGPNNVFSFLQTRSPQPNQGGGTVNQVRHAPIVIGFKVPFLATNSLFSLPNLQDSARLTVTTLRSIEEIEKEMAQVKAAREQFVADILANKEAKPIINCDGMPQCSGGEDQALVQALIDMINGSGQTCSAFKGPYENAGDLGSPAAANESKEFQDPYFSAVLPASNSAVFRWNLEVADENAPALAAQDKVPVTAHIIAPYGTDLKFLEESMHALFGTEELEKRIQENCIEDFNGECGMIPEYFTFGGVLADLNADDASFDFIYNDNPECDTPEGRSSPDCQELTMGGSLTEQPRQPLRILGAQIGWFIQQIQLKFRGATNRAHAYIQECKRTEDLFLGRCLGFQGKPGGSESNAANSCNDYRGINVDLPSSFNELGNLVCDVANNNASDVQLLWGLTQVDGAPMNRAIRDGKGSMSCGDLILNTCGASQIVGIIVPQCADLTACPQVGWALDDGVAGQKYREEITPDVVCSVRGSLEWILQKRKSEVAFLREEYRKANGLEPSTKQLYYMMAGRNLGLSMDILTQPACQGAGPIDTVGVCAGLNYCECVMDKLSYRCGQNV